MRSLYRRLTYGETPMLFIQFLYTVGGGLNDGGVMVV